MYRPPADKDLFSEFYRKKLARRLLHSTSGERRPAKQPACFARFALAASCLPPSLSCIDSDVLPFPPAASEDHEKGVLTRLKQQCGAQFTSKVRCPAGLRLPHGARLC
jgi:hypothetical protein